MGKNNVYKALRRFGFGSHTGIPLRPESTGRLRKPQYWDYLSITRFSIGQGVAVTPVQLARGYCALANGGFLPQLRLIDRLEDTSTGKVIDQKVDRETKVYMRDKTSKEIVAMMKKVTQPGGTAVKAGIKGYSVAGKTGTSQKWIPTNKKLGIRGHYSTRSENKYFATFVGFVPADNPAFVLLVMADEPQGAHYGGVVSAPTFREISKRALAYLNIPPDMPEKTEK